MTYYIHELQNLNSIRQPIKYDGTLLGAKMYASKNQVWQGTILKITDEKGAVLAVKDTVTGKWFEPGEYWNTGCEPMRNSIIEQVKNYIRAPFANVRSVHYMDSLTRLYYMQRKHRLPITALMTIIDCIYNIQTEKRKTKKEVHYYSPQYKAIISRGNINIINNGDLWRWHDMRENSIKAIKKDSKYIPNKKDRKEHKKRREQRRKRRDYQLMAAVV